METEYKKYQGNTKSENIGFQFYEYLSFMQLNFYASTINQCRFINCYFKEADFSQCIFTGSHFINCEFKNCTFQDNTFDYCMFTDCRMEELKVMNGYKIDKYAPASDLANILSLNAEKYGKVEESKILFLLHKRYKRIHENEYLHLSQEYYIQNANEDPSRVKKARKYLRCDFFDHWFWNYGYGIKNIIISILLVYLLFALLYIVAGDHFVVGLTRSLVSISTLGFINESSNGTCLWTNFIMGIEAVFGAFFIAIIASMAYNHIRRHM